MDKGNKVGSWLKVNIIPIFITILSIYFIFSGAVKVGVQQLEWYELLLFICTTLIFGVVISSLVADTGYSAGKKDEGFIKTRQLAVETAKKALPYREECEEYVSKLIDNDIVEDRREILALAGIKYEEIFDKNGLYILTKREFKSFRLRKRKAIIKARLIKKQQFTLFGFASGNVVGRKKAPNETERKKEKFISTLIIRVVIAIVSGSIMFSYIGISIASVVYSAYQLMIWIGSGLVARQGNYDFITVEMKEYDQDRIWWLDSFMALSEEDKQEYTKKVNKIKVEK